MYAVVLSIVSMCCLGQVPCPQGALTAPHWGRPLRCRQQHLQSSQIRGAHMAPTACQRGSIDTFRRVYRLVYVHDTKEVEQSSVKRTGPCIRCRKQDSEMALLISTRFLICADYFASKSSTSLHYFFIHRNKRRSCQKGGWGCFVQSPRFWRPEGVQSTDSVM
jgi:hypothetical protein